MIKLKFLNILKNVLYGVAMAVAFATASTSVYAMEDGAYTIDRRTSYVNPDTGNTMDGGTNIALGESMCASIVDEKLLVEQINGKTYVTIGLGLMSNIEDVHIQVQDESGTYREAEITKTGSCQRDGDTCNHYRFEVSSADRYISPIIYVTPMGRNVQFFIIPNSDSAQPGTGSFVSEMITENPQTSQISSEDTTVSTSEQAQTEPAETTEGVEVTKEAKSTEMADFSEKEKTSDTDNMYQSVILWVISGVIVVLVCGGIIWLYVKKRK